MPNLSIVGVNQSVATLKYPTPSLVIFGFASKTRGAANSRSGYKALVAKLGNL